MTGRDLIVYILQNKLENEPVFKDGSFLGLMTIEQAAAKFEVGKATVYAWVALDMIPCVMVGNEEYIPAHVQKPNLLG
jgi:excisionase family DNA binding protein